MDGDRTNGCESAYPNGVPEASALVLWLPGEQWNGTTWIDLSGGARNAASGFYGTPGTSTLNGKNVVNFNGGELLVSAGFPAWSGFTVFAVNNTSTDDSIITMGVSYNPGCATTPGASGNWGAPNCVAYDMLSFGSGMSLQQCDPSIGSCWQVYSPGITGKWVRSEAELTPGANPSFHSYYNGADNGSSLGHNENYPYPAPWGAAGNRKDTVLGWRNYRGYVAEIIVFNKPLSDASRNAIDSYLAYKWNVH
jgi:hypothetical protein